MTQTSGVIDNDKLYTRINQLLDHIYEFDDGLTVDSFLGKLILEYALVGVKVESLTKQNEERRKGLI